MEGVTIVTTSPFQLIDLAMSAGFFLGCVVIVPIFIYYLYRFIRPGLLPRERRVFMLSLPVSLGLFILGFLYSCVMLYFAVNLVAQVNVSLGVVNYWDIGLFVSQMVLTSSLLGVLFVYPIIITFLIKLRLLTVEFLVSKRRHAIVGIFVLVSLLPPTDGLSLILMSAPLVLIFELTILCNRKNRRV